jgi:CBS domain-containing protein
MVTPIGVNREMRVHIHTQAFCWELTMLSRGAAGTTQGVAPVLEARRGGTKLPRRKRPHFMQTVKDVLEHKGREVLTIDPDATVFEAIDAMAGRDIGALVVMEGARLVGLMTEREYARQVALAGRTSRDTRVRDVMLLDPPTITSDQEIGRAMRLMTDRRVRHLPVVEGPELVGLVSIGDIVAAIIGEQKTVIEHLEHYIAG